MQMVIPVQQRDTETPAYVCTGLGNASIWYAAQHVGHQHRVQGTCMDDVAEVQAATVLNCHIMIMVLRMLREGWLGMCIAVHVCDAHGGCKSLHHAAAADNRWRAER